MSFGGVRRGQKIRDPEKGGDLGRGLDSEKVG